MRHITQDLSPAQDVQVALRRAIIALGPHNPSGSLTEPQNALVKVHALLEGIYNELDHLTVALHEVPRLHGALHAAVHALGYAATVADTESRVRPLPAA